MIWTATTLMPRTCSAKPNLPRSIAGSRGTIVLWHAQLAHVIGANSRSDCIRIASIHDFWLTPEALPDAVLRARCSSLVGEAFPSLWDDWSAEVQAVPPAAEDAAAAAPMAAARCDAIRGA